MNATEYENGLHENAPHEDSRHGLAGATVLQIIPAMVDDRIGRYALDLAAALLRAGARALIAGESGPLVGELQAVGGEWMEHAFGSGGLLQRRRSRHALGALVATERVDLMIAYGIALARPAVAAAKSSGVPVVVCCQGLPPGRAGRLRAGPLTQADVVLTQSEYAASVLARDHGVAIDRVGVIPQSIDLDWFDPTTIEPGRVEPLRQAWQVAPHQRILLAPGRVAAGSDHLGLVDALRILVNGGLRDIVAVIAGEGPDDPDRAAMLAARIQAQGLADVVRYIGVCDDMPAAYAAADLIVLPADRPAVFDERACEALAMGRPVVAAHIGALAELVLAPPRTAEAGRTGWHARPRDTFDLARVLAAAMAVESSQWLAIGENGRRYAERKFSAPRVADATLAVCGALLNDSNSAQRR